MVALTLIALLGAGVALAVVKVGNGSASRTRAGSSGTHISSAATTTTTTTAKPPPPSSYAVGLRVLHLVDTSRTIENRVTGASERRPLLTYVRYPVLGTPGSGDQVNAPAAVEDGPFPLIVFGHGFAVTPNLYAHLLQSWASAGYVVAAPVFPLENADAPGGPDEGDLTNQPADMSFVISQMLEASSAPSGPFTGLIDPKQIAVAGQSDGGDTALAVAYDPTYRDPRVDAAVILSGAEIPGLASFTFGPGSPPLLATQGTADPVNPPGATNAFFEVASRPKYLLRLFGAEHLPPYSTEQPQLGIVERVSTAFLDGYLKHRSAQLQRLGGLGNVSGVSALQSEP